MKLKLSDRLKIIELRNEGMPIKKVAGFFGVSRSRISQIFLYEQESIKAKLEAEKIWEEKLKES
tara:strand:- start:321 stop:512 length:192 start_codon:yes stop_codon:yes gene_type:complete